MSGHLDFVVREGDQIARLGASHWPMSARLSWYKVAILERTGVLERRGDAVLFGVANGSAIYRVIGEREDEIMLVFVEGKLIWPG